MNGKTIEFGDFERSEEEFLPEGNRMLNES